MAEIKSTLEIALEKANRISKMSQEEEMRLKYEEEGKRLAVKYLNNKELTFKELMKNIDPKGLNVYIDGIMDVLLRNILLPKEKEQWESIDRALKGISEIKGSSANTIIKQLKQFLNSYEETKNAYYEQLKMQFESRMSGIQELIAQQYGKAVSSKVTVEALPQFQQEWQKISSEITNQYQQKINQIKEILKNIS